MRQIILALWFVVLLICVSPFRADSGLVLTQPDGFAINCATGFVRQTPHYCALITPSGNGLNLAGTCQLLNVNAIWGVPTNAAFLRVYLKHQLFGLNVAGANRSINTAFHTPAACGGVFIQVSNQAREWVAVNNLLIHIHSYTLDVPSTSTGMPYISSIVSGGAGSNADVTLMGYYD